jgi:hypothetical protein
MTQLLQLFIRKKKKIVIRKNITDVGECHLSIILAICNWLHIKEDSTQKMQQGIW